MKGNYRVKEPIIPLDPPVYKSLYTPEKPGVLDGDLDKPFWQKGEWITEFHDIEGDSLPRPWKNTRVKVLWDEEALYVGALLEEDSIWATVKNRDEVIFQDNDFEIFLAPENTGHRYYEIEMNALNTVWDLYMERPQRDRVRRIISWDIKGLESAVKIAGEINNPAADNRYWSLEMKIPWFSLRESPADRCLPQKHAPVPGEIWRMDFSRVEYDTDIIDGRYVKRKDPETQKNLPEHNWLWSPTGIIDAHVPEMWGYLVFSKDGEDYDLPEEDGARFVLRKLYYRQHAHACKHGCFTSDAKALLGDEADAYGVKAYVTPSLFEGTLEWKGVCYHIDQDGYLWAGEER